jgi:hypothetical protein
MKCWEELQQELLSQVLDQPMPGRVATEAGPSPLSQGQSRAPPLAIPSSSRVDYPALSVTVIEQQQKHSRRLGTPQAHESSLGICYGDLERRGIAYGGLS